MKYPELKWQNQKTKTHCNSRKHWRRKNDVDGNAE